MQGENATPVEGLQYLVNQVWPVNSNLLQHSRELVSWHSNCFESGLSTPLLFQINYASSYECQCFSCMHMHITFAITHHSALSHLTSEDTNYCYTIIKPNIMNVSTCDRFELSTWWNPTEIKPTAFLYCFFNPGYSLKTNVLTARTTCPMHSRGM